MIERVTAFLNSFKLFLHRTEAEHVIAEASLNDLVEIDKRAAANKKNIGRIDLEEFLVRMFSSTLGRDISNSALKYL